MTTFSVIWLCLFAAFLATEITAIVVKDRPGQNRTLTANVRWLIRTAGPWHTAARGILGFVLITWLPVHFGYRSGGDVSNLDMWSALVGFLLPPVVAVANRPTWPSWARAGVTVAGCVLAALGTAWLNGTFDGGDLTRSALVVGFAAFGTYRAFWHPSGIAPAIEKATSPAPPPSAGPPASPAMAAPAAAPEVSP
jgi:hypothetical protein